MRILIMQPWISYRGAETVSVQECYYLNTLGHTAKIAAIYVDWKRLPNHGSAISYVLPPAWISQLCAQNKVLLLLFGPVVLFLLTLRHVRQYDVLNPHNLPTVWVAALIGTWFRKPVIWTAHGVPAAIAWKERKSLFEYIVWYFGTSRIDIWAVKSTTAIVAASAQVAKAIQKRYRKPATVLYNAVVKMSVSKKTLPKELTLLRKKTTLLLLHVGALHSQKRQTTSLHILDTLRREGENASIVFVGNGPDKEILEREVIRLGLSQYVYFAGFVNQQELGSYYELCDVNILPSVAETFSATPLEALMHKKISIVSSESGTKEILGNYVIIAQPTVAAMTKAIRHYLKTKQIYVKKITAGKSFLEQRFTWEVYCQKFIHAIPTKAFQEVPATVYDKKYFAQHHEKQSDPLQKERRTRLQRAIDYASVTPGMKVLDLGCGNGDLMIRLVHMGAEVWGIDYSEDAIALAKDRKKQLPSHLRSKFHTSVADAQTLPFQTSFFDRVICLDVFEHIYPEPLQQVISEMERVSKDAGLIIIETAPNKFFWGPVAFFAKKLFKIEKFESDEYHINVYDYFRFKKTLQQFSGSTMVTLHNDGHQFFSSRIINAKGVMPKWWIRSLAAIADFLHENIVSEKVILASPLKLFLAHDLWGVVQIQKKKKSL